MNPLDLQGPAFLRFYAGCFAAAVVMVLVVRQLLSRSSWSSGDPGSSLHPIELAYLAGGPWRAIQVAVVSLVRREEATVSKAGTIYLEPHACLNLQGHPVECAIQLSARSKSIAFDELRGCVEMRFESVDERLAADGLLVSRGFVRWR